MLGAITGLIDKFQERRQAQQLLKNPVVKRGIEGIQRYWINNTEVTKDFSAGFISSESEKMLQAVCQVAVSENPLMANREMLSSWLITYAEHQVLVMDAPPVEDPTGLRGTFGISGELKSRLVEVAQKYENLKEFMHGFPEVKTWDDVWNPVLMRYRITHAWAHIFHMMRFDLHDYNSARDWFRPYLAAMCGWMEHQVRQSIGLPSLLDERPFEADMKSLMLSSFMNCVMSEARYPDLQFAENLKEQGLYYEALKPAYR